MFDLSLLLVLGEQPLQCTWKHRARIITVLLAWIFLIFPVGIIENGSKNILQTPARFSFWCLMLPHKSFGLWSVFIYLNQIVRNPKLPQLLHVFPWIKRLNFFIRRGLLKIKPCSWRWRQLWEEVTQSIPTLSTRTGSFPRHSSTVTARNLLRFPNHCLQRKAVIYVSLHSFDNDWFVFSLPFHTAG